MAIHKLADRVRETSTTAGTGTYNLAGAATGYQTFVDGIGTGKQCYYAVEDGTDWEVGLGTVTDAAPDTLSRDTILASSNANAAVNWGVGTRNVFCSAPAVLFPGPEHSFTPTGSHVSNATYTGWWWKTGPNRVSLRIRIQYSGATTAAVLTIDTPTGMVVDESKFGTAVSTEVFDAAVGQGWMSDNSGGPSRRGPFIVFYRKDTNLFAPFVITTQPNTLTQVSNTVPVSAIATGDVIELTINDIPVTAFPTVG